MAGENETSDTITRQFVEGCGIVELPNGEKFQEPIREMTVEEILDRERLRIANTSEKLRKQREH